MITNNGEPNIKNKQPGRTILVSVKTWNYLAKQKRLLKNEHQDNIYKLLRDSKEYRRAFPHAPWLETMSGGTKAVRVSINLYRVLNDLRYRGALRTDESEYSFARVLNDLLSDSEKLNDLEQKAMSEITKEV